MRIFAIMVATVVGGLIGQSLADEEPSDYEATSLYTSTIGGPTADTIVNTFATLLDSASFRRELSVAVGEDLDASSLQVSVPDSTGVINVTVRAPTAQEVLAISEQILPTFLLVGAETAPDIDLTTAVVDVFGAPSEPVREESSTIWPALGGAIVGLALGVLVVTLWPRRRSRGVPSLEEAEAASGIPFRAAVPNLHERSALGQVSPHDATYALLRAGTDRWWRRPVRLILLIPCTQDRRALDLAIDLATAATDGGNHALLVDADLEGGALSRRLDRSASPGLTDATVQDGRILATVSSVPNRDRPILPFLSSGTGSTDASISVIAPLITQLRDFNVAIAVTSPFDEQGPLAELIEVADGIIVAGIAGQTTSEEIAGVGDLLRSLAAIDRASGALLGAARLDLRLEPLEPAHAT